MTILTKDLAYLTCSLYVCLMLTTTLIFMFKVVQVC